jgi:gamma-glutamyltranspeptidase/glutathione hydrolase
MIPGTKTANYGIGWLLLLLALTGQTALAASAAHRAQHGMVVTQSAIASDVGAQVLRAGGNAIDAAVATAFALAVTYPEAGNIGGGGFLVYQPHEGGADAYDFRETAPTGSHPEMWLDEEGGYSPARQYVGPVAAGVPGTVAGLHRAWRDHGSLPWAELVAPAIALARNGFPIPEDLARTIAATLPRMEAYPASLAQFSRDGTPMAPGELLVQRDLARTLELIAADGPDAFYRGPIAEQIVALMASTGGLITAGDLASYRAVKRKPIRGTYRGYEIVSMPPPSSGGVALVQTLNMLEGYDIAGEGFGSARTLHLITEALRRTFADRARYLADPDFVKDMPVRRLTSKSYAADLRETISLNRAGKSSPATFEWPTASNDTAHFSVVDAQRNAVSLTYTLNGRYGNQMVVPGAGFLLNNEMGDFNPVPGLTDERGLIGTTPNLAAPGKRMLSSMSPTIVLKDGEVFMVTGARGGRSIISTVLQTIMNVVDHGMNAQAAVDARRIHHQWLPDRLRYEPQSFSRDTLNALRWLGHEIEQGGASWSNAEVIVVADDGWLEGGDDRRRSRGSVAGY